MSTIGTIERAARHAAGLGTGCTVWCARFFATWTVWICLVVLAPHASAQPPPEDLEPSSLHQKIDQVIERASGPLQLLAPAVSEEEDVRRLYLDLLGRIPSVAELMEYRREVRPDKRVRLIDRLLQSPACDRHLAVVFDVMWMERRADKHVPTPQWRTYLQEAFASGRPLNQIVYEILSADGTSTDLRGAAKFYLDREMDTHSVTQDVSRMFFGRDIECAQCHDHPLISDYLQSEYYGLFAFFYRSELFTPDGKDKQVVIREKAEGTPSFSSVFEPDTEKTIALAALPDGRALDDEPVVAKDERYRTAPAKNVRGVPRFSRREQLARWAASGDSSALNENLANRLWRVVMGLGLVDPVDLNHSDNLAAYPQLLEQLGRELAAMDFDTKQFLRELVLTQTYRRSIQLPGDWQARLTSTGSSLNRWRQEMADEQARVEQQLQHVVVRCEVLAQQLAASRADLREHQQKLQALLDKGADLRAEGVKLTAKQKPLVEQLASTRQATTALRATIGAGEQAAELLDKEPDLIAALAVFRERLVKAEASEVNLQKKAAQCADEIAANEQQRREQQAAIAPVREEYDAMLQELTVLAAEHRDALGSLHHWQRKLETLEQDMSLAQYLGELYQLVSDQSTQQQQLTMLRSRLEGLAQSVATEQSRQKDWRRSERILAKQHQELEGTIERLDEQLRHRQLAIDAVRAAADQTRLALERTGPDSDLQDALQTLVTRAGQLATQLAEPRRLLEQVSLARSDNREKLASLRQSLLDSEKVLLARADEQRELNHQIDSLEKRLAEIRAELVRREPALADRLAARFALRPVRPLSPEQLAASTVEGLGLRGRYMREAVQEGEKLKKENKPADVQALYQQRFDRVVATFVSLFANSPGSPQDEFYATVDQALFWANDGRVADWLRPVEGSLTKELFDLRPQGDDKEIASAWDKWREAIADRAYASVLSRSPSEEERDQVVEALRQQTADPQGAVNGLVWSLLSSSEFRFYH